MYACIWWLRNHTTRGHQLLANLQKRFCHTFNIDDIDYIWAHVGCILTFTDASTIHFRINLYTWITIHTIYNFIYAAALHVDMIINTITKAAVHFDDPYSILTFNIEMTGNMSHWTQSYLYYLLPMFQRKTLHFQQQIAPLATRISKIWPVDHNILNDLSRKIYNDCNWEIRIIK